MLYIKAFVLVTLGVGAIIVGPILVLVLAVILGTWGVWRLLKYQKENRHEFTDSSESPRFVGGAHLFRDRD